MRNQPTDPLIAALSAALFTSPLSAHSRPSHSEIREAINTAIRSHGDTRGCAIELAGEYGDHPETAAARMRWARHIVEWAYGRSPVAVERP